MANVHTLPPPQQSSLTTRRQEVEYIVLAEAQGTSETGLLDYLSLLRRHKWLLVLPMVCILPLIGFFILTQKPRYSARATVLIEDTNPKVLAIAEVAAPEKSPNFYNTQYELIKSRSVAEEVVEKLHLYPTLPSDAPPPEPTLFQTVQASLESLWQDIVVAVRGPQPEAPEADEVAAPFSAELERQKAVGRLLNALEVEPRKGTKLVDITLRGSDPSQVALQVNTLAAAYTQQNLENRLQASRKATIWLHKEAENLRQKIGRGERQLHTLKEDKRLVGSDTTSVQQNNLQNLGALNLSYLEKHRERMALRADLDELRKLLTSADLIQSAKYPALLANATINGLRTRYIDLQIQSSELGKKFMDKHPKMIALAEQVAEVRKAMTGEVRRVIASLENQYAALVTQENELKQFFDTQKNTAIQSEKDLTTYETLRRDLDIDKAMYLEVSKRLAETTITAALETNNVTVVEEALMGRPVSAGSIKYLLIGLLFSLGCGAGLVALAEVFDKRFKNVAEAEQSLALPFLGLIPHYVLPKSRPPALITMQKPWSEAAEAYHTLRTWIQLAEPPVQSLLVTSACASEGKSTTAANLAVSFAQLGRRVLLVDADLRHPSLHRIFGDTQGPGLTDVLVHGLEWDSVVREAPMENFKVLFTGACPLNPTELLSMARLRQLITQWKEAFDLVIFDAPIVLTIPDVVILAPMIDGVLLVHSQARSTRAMAAETKRQLERANARLLGMIFNNVYPKDKHYYTPYYSGNKYSTIVTPARPQRSIEHRDIATAAIERRAASGPQQWTGPGASPVPASALMPVVIRREDDSHQLHITLHTVTVCRHIGSQQAEAGTVFLLVDVEIANTGTFGHLFDPNLAALTARGETDYGRVLASFIPIYDAADDTAVLQTSGALLHYDPVLTAHVGGFATVIEIAADQTSRGTLVYHISEASGAYAFVYTNPPIALTLLFSLLA